MAKLKKQKRPATLEGRTYRIETNHGRLFVTVNFYKGKPFEVFLRIGKHGGDLGPLVEPIARMISNDLRHGMPVLQIVKQLEISATQIPPMVADAVAKVLRKTLENDES